MNPPDIKSADVSGKRVFVRADLDVSLKDGTIQDDTRLHDGFETIQYLLDQNATVIIGGHLGRPGGKVVPELTLEPIARWLLERFKIKDVRFKKIGEFDGWEIGEKIFLLENLRFNPGEESNDREFAKKLASTADIYVNEAFAVCHRDHASITGIASLLPHFAGFGLQQEIGELSKVLKNPAKPLVVIIGGKKMETKLPLVKKMLDIADSVLVGGKLAHEIEQWLHEHNGESKNHYAKLVIGKQIDDKSDITHEDALSFAEIIKNAGTVVWNGPMGIVEEGKDNGTKIIAQAIATSNAHTIVGGGDTVEYVRKIGLFEKYSFVSTGGGAMLAFLSGEKLPGLTALET